MFFFLFSFSSSGSADVSEYAREEHSLCALQKTLSALCEHTVATHDHCIRMETQQHHCHSAAQPPRRRSTMQSIYTHTLHTPPEETVLLLFLYGHTHSHSLHTPHTLDAHAPLPLKQTRDSARQTLRMMPQLHMPIPQPLWMHRRRGRAHWMLRMRWCHTQRHTHTRCSARVFEGI